MDNDIEISRERMENMLAIERQNRILANLQINQTALVSELSKEYSVTEETIRRDLEKLERRGLVKKTYGGAIYGQDIQMDAPFKLRPRRNVNPEDSLRIAKNAAELVLDGETVMIDASACAIHFIRALKPKKNLRVITNSVEILTAFGFGRNMKIISTGGILQDSGLSLAGSAAEQTIRFFHVDKTFLTCEGIDLENGITEYDDQEADIKKSMAASAKQVVLMADADKFNRTSFIRFLELDRLHAIVTNEKPDENWRNFLAGTPIEWIW